MQHEEGTLKKSPSIRDDGTHDFMLSRFDGKWWNPLLRDRHKELYIEYKDKDYGIYK